MMLYISYISIKRKKMSYGVHFHLQQVQKQENGSMVFQVRTELSCQLRKGSDWKRSEEGTFDVILFLDLGSSYTNTFDLKILFTCMCFFAHINKKFILNKQNSTLLGHTNLFSKAAVNPSINPAYFWDMQPWPITE